MKEMQGKNQGRQGDVFFRRVGKIPEDARKADAPVDGRYVMGHSETGHEHVMLAEDVEIFYTDDPFISYARVKKANAALVHEKNFDTHETCLFDEGIFEFRNQREFVPEGFRRVTD